ncbi:MAG: hypothetical protein Q4G62_09810 [Pseudomonadota bacterium]|nr:hypothetical protein [Pseudomonadota bacterium]
MTFTCRNLALLTSAICFALAAVWLTFPNVLLGIWGGEFFYSTGLVARRAAALFFGVGLMLWLLRESGPSDARSAIIKGFAVACLALALLGSYELISGNAGPRILMAIGVELVLAAMFIAFVRRERKRVHPGA